MTSHHTAAEIAAALDPSLPRAPSPYESAIIPVHRHQPTAETIMHAVTLHAYTSVCECGERIYQRHGSRCDFSRGGRWQTWAELAQ
jgi:hypothetical protein